MRYPPWFDAHLSFTLEDLGSKQFLHTAAELGYFVLLNVLYFLSSKTLLSLCHPPQILSLSHALVSANSSKYLEILPHAQSFFSFC